MAVTKLKTENQKIQPPKVFLRDLTPSLRLNDVVAKFPLSREKLAQLLHVSPRTINRWIKSGTGPEKREHIVRLSRIHAILELGGKVYTEKGLKDFFMTTIPEFEHQTAFDMLSIGKFDVVLSALAADFEGLSS